MLSHVRLEFKNLKKKMNTCQFDTLLLLLNATLLRGKCL